MKRKKRGAFVCAECRGVLPHSTTEVIKVNGCQVLVHTGRCMRQFKEHMATVSGKVVRLDKFLSLLTLPEGVKFPESPGAIRKSQYREGGERIGTKRDEHKRRIGSAGQIGDSGVTKA